MADLSEYQKDILVRTILGEARGEGLDGMEAVAQVIRNRTNSGRFPSDPAAVALQPSQFSVWNTGAGGGKTDYNKNSDLYRKAEQAVERVFSGQVPDRTNGALFYHTPSVSPNWAGEVNKYGTTQLGNHIFYNGRPTPPGEIPNQVASLTDTVGPRVAPRPATISPDLAQMRNPVMSSSARNAQVTPSPNVPLPRNRPSAPDVVTPTMASLASAPRPNANTRRAVDTGLLALTPVTPRLTPAGDNIMSYHIPDMTPTAVVGGVGSLTPPVERQRLPELPRTVPGQSQIERIGPTAREIAMAPGTTVATIPTTGIGQPPATRTVQSVPWQTPSAREIAEAQGTTVATVPTAAQALNMRSRDSVANAALGQRVATQLAPAFGQSVAPSRLVPNPIVQPNYVPLNQPPIQVIPGPSVAPRRVAPTPMAASSRPLGLSTAPRPVAPAARVAQPSAPLRITVNGAGSYSAPAPQQTTLVRALMAQGLSPSQAYNAANAQGRGAPSLEDRITGRSTQASSGASAYSISG